MDARANVREFKTLEAEIVASETDLEQKRFDLERKRWRQAALAAEAITDGMSQRIYAEQVGKGQRHIGILVRMWKRWGEDPGPHRPRFADAYVTVKLGSDELVTRAEQSRRERERRVPTRSEDRVEMATELMSDPDVVEGVLAQPARARSEIQTAVARESHDRRERTRKATKQRRRDDALPLPAHMNAMVLKLNEWATEMAALVDDLDGLPEGRGRELVAEAARGLTTQAQRWVDRLEHRPDLRVIEGSVS